MPAFAESVVNSQQGFLSPTKTTQALRATVIGTPQFTETAAAGGGGGSLFFNFLTRINYNIFSENRAFDWLTGGNYDTFAGSLGASMDTDETGLMFASRALYQKLATDKPGALNRAVTGGGMARSPGM